MANLSITKNYSDGSALTEAMLDAIKSSVETYINNRNAGSTAWDALSVTGAATLSSTLGVTGVLTPTGGIASLFGYRRPNLIFSSVTAINVENNTGTAHQTTIVFPDGTIRSVTEDVSSTHKYRQFLITATAEFTSGTEDSGLRSGISETTNTWYAIYAVKSAIDATKFVLSGDTTLPLQANFSTLNTRYGTNGWVYLGMIRNGNNADTTGDILSFKQAGGIIVFTNATVATGSTRNVYGIVLASTAIAADTVTYTYSAGTGTTDIPNHVSIGTFMGVSTAVAGTISLHDPTPNRIRASHGVGPESLAQSGLTHLTGGIQAVFSSTAGLKDLLLLTYIDPLLLGGINPLL